MSLPGERLIMAATLDSVQQGDTFETMPPHMTVIRWHAIEEHRRHFLTDAMDRLFTDKPVFGNAMGGRKAQLRDPSDPVAARLVRGTETVEIGSGALVNPQWFALHALVRSIGIFDEEDEFKDIFTPHITDTEDFKLKYRQRINFKSVVLFGTKGKHLEYRAVSSSQLGHK